MILLLNAVPIPANDALDNTVLTFTISGDSNWYAQDATFIEELSALISNAIDHKEPTSVFTGVKRPGVLQLYWKGSPEPKDGLSFFIEDVLFKEKKGMFDWLHGRFRVPAGNHTLKWSYVKDGSDTGGDDCGYLYGIKYHITLPSPVYDLQLLE